MEEGLLSLEDTVSKWFPEIDQSNNITINHLLTHTSGITSFDNLEEYKSNIYLYRNPEEILLIVKNKKLLFQPGKHYAYSNTGYLLLGIIIERITGKSYEETVEKYILKKIGLHETEVITSEIFHNYIVRGHHHGNILTAEENYTITFAAGSIIATPKDLIIFFQGLMSGSFLSQSSLQIMFSDMNLMTIAQSTYYGKGIVAAIGTPVGNIIGHTGAIKGFGASLFYHPKRNIFVCVMMNDDIKPVDPAMFKLLEAMMDL
jgi:CubicO group peptidase (beta-lactamase class C family)